MSLNHVPTIPLILKINKYAHVRPQFLFEYTFRFIMLI